MNPEEEKGGGDADLCSTPAVDADYLVSLSTRLTNFAAQKKSKIDTLLLMQESIKKRLQEAKEARMGRLGAIKMQHRQILDMVATLFGIDYKVVEEGVIDDPLHIKLVESLTEEGGRRAVIFLFQYMEPPPLESGRGLPDNTPPFRRVVVTDGSDIPISDRAIVVYRIKGHINIEQKNVCDDMLYASLEIDPNDINTVSAMQGLMGRTSSRALEVFTQWGELNKTNSGLAAKKEFLDEYKAFDNFITATKSDLDGKIRFQFPEEIYKNFLSTPEDVKIAARNPDVAAEVQAYGKIWVKQIERVLVEAEQIRREKDDVGPMAELEYWRKWLTKFTSVVEFIKTEKLKMCLQCLRLSRSKLIPLWGPLDNRITEACNEAADNVKYLYALERFSEPLYTCDPTTMGDHISSLMYTIRMIYATSRYYNTSERVTALLVKVTNQMVTSCRNYLTENGTKTVWEHKKKDIIAKMTVCLNLYKKYKKCFAETQRKISENPEEKAFGCSESNVFVKFESFRVRLERLTDVLNTYLSYSIIQSSRLEGIEVYVKKFNRYFNDIATKPYDALNHRKPYFDADYDIFKQQVNTWEQELRNFLGEMVAMMPNVREALRILSRFDKISLPCLLMNRKYLELLDKFYDEIAELRDRYNEDRQTCPVPRNMPPVSGRIFWIRQLYKRLEEPMEVFKTKKPVIEHPRAQRVIKLYNCICKVLVQYELVHHQLWCEHVPQVEQCLVVPILTKHPRKNMINVNFDNYIEEVIREVEYMWKLGLKVPDTAAIVCFQKEKLLGYKERIKALVLEYMRIRRSVPRLFLPLMRPLLYDLELAFNPGMCDITWVSLEIPKFCEQVEAKLIKVGCFIKELIDMKAARIDEPLLAISKTLFLEMPTDVAVSPQEFFESNVALRQHLEKEIETKYSVIEEAAIELIDRFVDTFDVESVAVEKYFWLDPSKMLKPSSSAMNLAISDEIAFRPVEKVTEEDLPQFKSDCMDMFAFFFQRSIDALVRATKASLEALRRRAFAFTVVTAEESSLIKPFLYTNMILQIPNISIIPSLDEIQFYCGKVVSNILEIHKGIIQWGQRSDKLAVVPEELGPPEAEEVEKETKVDTEEEEQEEGAEIPGEEEEPFDGDRSSKLSLSKGKLKNYYKLIADHKEIVRNVMSLQGAMLLLKPDVSKCNEYYLKYAFLWADDREAQVKAFVEGEPIYQDIKEKFTEFVNNIEEVQSIPERHVIGALEVRMGADAYPSYSRFGDVVGFKGKKESKKRKELKGQGKYEDSMAAEGKNRHSKHSHDHQRSIRSLKDSKMRVVIEEPMDDRSQFSQVKGKKAQKSRSEVFAEPEEHLNAKRWESSWSKKSECGAGEKRKQKCHRLRIEEAEESLKERKGSPSKGPLNGEGAEVDEELFPEDHGYRVRSSKRARRERKIPAFLILEEADETGEPEPRYAAKILKRAAPRLIIDSGDNVDLENVTGHQHLLEEPLEEPSHEWNLNETEEEYEEDFL